MYDIVLQRGPLFHRTDWTKPTILWTRGDVSQMTTHYKVECIGSGKGKLAHLMSLKRAKSLSEVEAEF